MFKTVHGKYQLPEKKDYLVHGEATRLEKRLNFDLVSKRLLFSTTNSPRKRVMKESGKFVRCGVLLPYVSSLPLIFTISNGNW